MTDTDLPPRPVPSRELLELDIFGRIEPAPEVLAWVREVILDPAGPVHNPDHNHLSDADIGFLWATAENTSKGKRVIGMAEIPQGSGDKWKRARRDQQLREWFGDVPDFVITLDAYFCEQASDIEFLALVEHELYHCAQEEDEFGSPKFNNVTGLPSWKIRGHDVEEFVGVVRRYGVVSEEVQDLVIAAANKPEVSRLNVARACGTCRLRSV